MKGRLPKAWPWFAAVVSGVMLALCFAPFDADGFVWIWQGPLLASIWLSRDPVGAKRGALLGYVTGFVFFGINVWWMNEVSAVGGSVFVGLGAWLALVIYLSVYFGAFGAFAATVAKWDWKKTGGEKDLFGQSIEVLRVAFLCGVCWCGLEWVRGWLFTGFGWNGLGVALVDHLLLVQFADTIGIVGYGFVMMFAGTIGFCTIVRLALEVKERKRLRPHADFSTGVALIIALFLYGMAKVTEVPEKSVDLRARVMQLNIPLGDKWSEDDEIRRQIVYDYRDLTTLFVESSPVDLVLWPETALPGHFNFPWVQDFFNKQILPAGDFSLLTGLEDSTLQGDEIYNTITLMKGDTESYQMYKKMHLVPLGEYIPFRGKFPLFEWIAGGIIENDFTPGTETGPLVIEKEGVEIGIVPLICFEDTVPRHARKFLRDGPQIMVNVTNDGWFFDSAQPMQHFRNALFRCIEFRRPMIRAANTGVSGFVDERGSVYERNSGDRFPRILRDEETGSTYIRGSIPGTVVVDLDPPMTIYASYGDWFAVTMAVVALLGVGSFVVRRVRASELPA